MMLVPMAKWSNNHIKFTVRKMGPSRSWNTFSNCDNWTLEYTTGTCTHHTMPPKEYDSKIKHT